MGTWEKLIDNLRRFVGEKWAERSEGRVRRGSGPPGHGQSASQRRWGDSLRPRLPSLLRELEGEYVRLYRVPPGDREFDALLEGALPRDW